MAAAQVIVKGQPYGVGPIVSWWLVPRRIPLLEEVPQRMAAVRRTQGVAVDPGFLLGRAPLTVPANTRAVILLRPGFRNQRLPPASVSAAARAARSG
jgi:alpha-L-rhamnosidase